MKTHSRFVIIVYLHKRGRLRSWGLKLNLETDRFKCVLWRDESTTAVEVLSKMLKHEKNPYLWIKFRKILTPGHVVSRLGFRMWLDSRLLPYLFQTIGWDYSNSDRHTQIRAGDMQSPAMRILPSREWKRHTWDQLSPLLPPPSRSTLYLGPEGRSLPLSPNQSNWRQFRQSANQSSDLSFN